MHGRGRAWLWRLLEKARTPRAQQRLSVRQIDSLLRAARVRRLEAAAVHAVVHQPQVFTAPGVVEAVGGHIALLLPRLTLTVAQRRDAARHLEHLLDALEREEAPAGDHVSIRTSLSSALCQG